MVQVLLDLVGVALLIVAATLAFGPVLGLAALGVACLAVSWASSR